jgi:DNA transformation protein
VAHDQDEILDRLSALGEVSSRPLFGGHGLYWRETIFGILFGGRLYLKVDDRSKDDYVSRGMGPLRPNERQTLKSYL